MKTYFQNSSTAATVWLLGAMERLPFSNVSGIQQFSVFQYPSTNIINVKNRRIKENNALYKNLLLDFVKIVGELPLNL